MTDSSLKAVVHLSSGEGEASRLKRLALLFDEVYFVRPRIACLSEDAAQQAESAMRRKGLIELDLLRDISYDMALLSVGDELEEVLAALCESGVAIDATKSVNKAEKDDRYRKWRDALIAQAASDSEWNALTDTPQGALDHPDIRKVELRDMVSGEMKDLWYFREPSSIWRTDVIASTSHLAQGMDGFPLFAEGFRPLLAYRCQLYRSSGQILEKEGIDPLDLTGHRVGFGQAAFAIGNSVFSSDSVAEKSVEETLKYRAEMDISRRRFLSSDLMDLAAMIAENPWGSAAEEEVGKYVQGKLAGDIAAFDAASVTTWEKLYGALAGRAASVGQAAGAGGGLGGITGQVVPHLSLWEMMIGGSVLGLSKELPGLIKDVAEAITESRDRRRSGIAYIASFNS